MILESYLHKHMPTSHDGEVGVDLDSVIFGAVDALGHWCAGQDALPHDGRCRAIDQGWVTHSTDQHVPTVHHAPP